jgi:hypothetical protein
MSGRKLALRGPCTRAVRPEGAARGGALCRELTRDHVRGQARFVGFTPNGEARLQTAGGAASAPRRR